MKNWIVASVVCSLLIATAILLNVYAPSRLTDDHVEASRIAVAAMAAAKVGQESENIVVASETSSSFKIVFECSMGDFTVECHPEWAPLGVQRLREAIEAGVYTEAYFFRVVPDFVVQFGIPGDPELSKVWRERRIDDDPVKESNTKGTLTFATSGTDSRTTQVFINLGNNQSLDARGFAPFGKVVKGMDVVEAINSKYGQSPSQGRIQAEGNTYIKATFPEMDFIKSVRILDFED